MRDVLDLRGTAVIVTGASSGIGAATARALHAGHITGPASRGGAAFLGS
jgi:NAD(P)-dependent dehydrogenase (short-subunit alcohol dehydrogenase family)